MLFASRRIKEVETRLTDALTGRKLDLRSSRSAGSDSSVDERKRCREDGVDRESEVDRSRNESSRGSAGEGVDDDLEGAAKRRRSSIPGRLGSLSKKLDSSWKKDR